MLYKKYLIAVLMLICFGSVYASSNNNLNQAAPANTNSWHFLIAPYAMMPWITGNAIIGGNKMDINTSPKDIIPHLDAVLELHMEATKGNWTFMFDPTYLKLSQSVDIGPAGSAKITMKQVLADFGEYYKFASLPVKGNPNNRFNIEGFFGGRYWYINNKVDFNLRPPISLPNISMTKKWLDPVIGGRLSYRVGNSWMLALSGDIGGFDLVSNFTWETKIMGIYQFSRYVGIAGGFRAVGVDYEDGQGAAKFRMDTVLYGPVLGITFVF